jgi:hypothetical protein
MSEGISYLTAVNLDNSGIEFEESEQYGWIADNNIGEAAKFGSDWTANEDGSYTLDTDGNFVNCQMYFGSYENPSTIQGLKYLVGVTFNESIPGNDVIRLRDCRPNIDFFGSGELFSLVVMDSSRNPSFNRRGGSPLVQTMSNITNRLVLELPGAEE